MAAEDRLAFYVEWFDSQADLIRRYMLTYYPRDNTIEMYDPKNHRSFLKRSECAGISTGGLYIGAVVTIHARQLKIIEYADVHTQKACESQKSRTLALVKPDAYNNVGNIISTVATAGLVIARLKMVRASHAQAVEFFRLRNPPGAVGLSSSYRSITNEEASHLAADVCIAMELVGEGAVAKWHAIMGPEDPEEARRTAPRSLRANLGTDLVKNAVHGSESATVAAAELDFFFGAQSWPTTALFNNCTLCVVRPHAFATAGGEIVNRILGQGFEISAMCLWYMDKATAEEFLEVYKGVMPEYHDMVDQLCTGPSLVMEVRQEDAVKSFRKLVGPHDPEVAKHLRPATLRAQFGVDRVKNAVHCTDLPEDGLVECEYFFNTLYSRGGA